MMALAGGYETTATLIATALEHVSTYKGELPRLPDDENIVDWSKVVQEVARLESPFYRVARVVNSPNGSVNISGQEVPNGTRVLLLLSEANRDLSFDNPNEFDPNRSDTGIPFGAGDHYCPGMPMAMAAAKEALRATTDEDGGLTGRVTAERRLGRLSVTTTAVVCPVVH